MKWECYDLEETKEFLGMYINHDHKDQKIFVAQSEYLNKFLAWFNVTTNPTSTPLPLDYVFKLNDKQCNPNFHQKYQQMVRSLIYLMIGSHPDIEFAVVKLAQQIENLSNKHYWAGLHFCRYLLNTYKYQIVYDGLSNESIVAYSDSDWAQNPESCKSMTCYFTLIAHGVTFWISCQQKTIALSLTKAEYMALFDYGCQIA